MIGKYTVDCNTGTKIYNGSSEMTKSNRSGMAAKDSSYPPFYERGHIQAASLGGTNGKENIAPMAKDLNHHSYLSVENGEKSALKKGYTVQSEKIAYASVQPGHMPDSFLVNDKVTYANGQTQEIHHSFANMMNAEQENLNATLSNYSEALNVPNPSDTLRENMSMDEYANLMEKTDDELPNLKDEYDEQIFITSANTEDANCMWMNTESDLESAVAVDASDIWEDAVSDEISVEGGDLGMDADLSVEKE